MNFFEKCAGILGICQSLPCKVKVNWLEDVYIWCFAGAGKASVKHQIYGWQELFKNGSRLIVTKGGGFVSYDML